MREQDDMAYIEARLPTHGEYGLEIYANEPMKEGDTFTHICQYLCSWLEKDFRAQYGQVFDREDMAFANQTLPLSYTGKQLPPLSYTGKQLPPLCYTGKQLPPLSYTGKQPLLVKLCVNCLRLQATCSFVAMDQ